MEPSSPGLGESLEDGTLARNKPGISPGHEFSHTVLASVTFVYGCGSLLGNFSNPVSRGRGKGAKMSLFSGSGGGASDPLANTKRKHYDHGLAKPEAG